MKKQLLTTSALVAAGMLAAPGLASAQTAPTSQPIQITVGGYMYQFFSYVSQDDRVNGGASGQATTTGHPTKFTNNHDGEIWFQGKTTLANGISAGLRVELEAATEADQIDESFAFVEGAFGRIELGSTDNSAFKTSIHSPEAMTGIAVGGGYMLLTGNLVANPTKSSHLNSPISATLPLFNDNDSERISYYTPRFEGFQLGFSYAPELTQDKHNNSMAFATGQDNSYHSSVSVGLNFTRAFGPIDVAASAGYAQYKKPDSSAVFNNASISDPKEYLFGAQIGYAGFRVGGSYLRQKDYQVLGAAASTCGAGTTGAGVTGVTDAFSHGSSYDLGLTYTFGPAVVGVSYFHGENRASSVAGVGDDKLDSYSVSGRYQLGPGVQVEASVFHAKIRGANYTLPASSGITNNNATGVITGLVLNF